MYVYIIERDRGREEGILICMCIYLIKREREREFENIYL